MRFVVWRSADLVFGGCLGILCCLGGLGASGVVWGGFCLLSIIGLGFGLRLYDDCLFGAFGLGLLAVVWWAYLFGVVCLWFGFAFRVGFVGWVLSVVMVVWFLGVWCCYFWVGLRNLTFCLWVLLLRGVGIIYGSWLLALVWCYLVGGVVVAWVDCWWRFGYCLVGAGLSGLFCVL